MEGLRTHDVARIGAALADTLRFVTPARVMEKPQTLAFLAALYTGFPDWHYDNDPPALRAGRELGGALAAGRDAYRPAGLPRIPGRRTHRPPRGDPGA